MTGSDDAHAVVQGDVTSAVNMALADACRLLNVLTPWPGYIAINVWAVSCSLSISDATTTFLYGIARYKLPV